MPDAVIPSRPGGKRQRHPFLKPNLLKVSDYLFQSVKTEISVSPQPFRLLIHSRQSQISSTAGTKSIQWRPLPELKHSLLAASPRFSSLCLPIHNFCNICSFPFECASRLRRHQQAHRRRKKVLSPPGLSDQRLCCKNPGPDRMRE
jgi:hypothetical protein